MSIDKLAGIYVYCMGYHTGQNSRLYKLGSHIGNKLRLNDNAIYEIQGIRRDNEWYTARQVYLSLEKRLAQ